ncbi:Mdm33 family-domain-containing protein [Multifurca ochricompacta]|uniref:Sensitive to high expression protein 9, mitochondrial n=1 Tax=Multifurca ochricompacta TaxID=376703 RepID=A0AAD4QQ83_9AGAM|nr:Mdm33 family-domain-containing protein [Multifurca ochricompacta]
MANRKSQSHPCDPPTGRNPPFENSTSTPSSSSSSTKAGGRIEDVQSVIQRWSERNSIAFRQHADTLVARLATSFTRLGGEINKVTGYDEIEALKRQVVAQEARISASRKAARDAKIAYEGAVQKRSNSQREVNNLLERKSMWTDTDVSRFTVLVRQDHALEQEEARAKTAVAQTEDDVEREFSALMRIILERYHEEQVWSDKIRNVSTYGQLAVLGVNVIVFVLAIALVEPWKRRRLAQAFERKVQELEVANLNAVSKGMNALNSRLERQDEVLARLAEVSSAPSIPVSQEKVTTEDERLALKFAGITLTNQDVKLIATSVSVSILAWAVRRWVGL